MALALVILGSFVLSKTVFGRMLYAIGNNVVIDTYRAKLLVRFQ